VRAVRNVFGTIGLMGVTRASCVQVTVRDDRGVEHCFASAPQRIVTLLLSLTETVCAMGSCARMLGTDCFSNWLAAAEALPDPGGLEGAQVDRLYALKPDLVLAARSMPTIDRLQTLGLRVVTLAPQRLGDALRTIGEVAKLLGMPEGALRCFRASIQALKRPSPASRRTGEVHASISRWLPRPTRRARHLSSTNFSRSLHSAMPLLLRWGHFPI